jgi:hypothetical protein
MVRLNLCAPLPRLRGRAGEGAAYSSPGPRPAPATGNSTAWTRDETPSPTLPRKRTMPAPARITGHKTLPSFAASPSTSCAPTHCNRALLRCDSPARKREREKGPSKMRRPGLGPASHGPEMAEAGTWPGLRVVVLLAVGRAISSPKPCWCPRGSDIAAGTRSRSPGRTAGR